MEFSTIFKDEQHFSEDSESTQGSDLDFEININVILPGGEACKLSVLARTPWGDLCARLFSQFKLSPSSHVIALDSSASSSAKRKASRPVGRMSINSVIITEKNLKCHSLHSHTDATDEHTVRLIVLLSRIHQCVLRVNPDLPLSTVFDLVCEKQQLSEKSKKNYEFRHPLQRDLTLNYDLSLNHYNLREIAFIEKQIIKQSPNSTGKSSHSQILHTARIKRKAPPPPSPLINKSSTKAPSTITNHQHLHNKNNVILTKPKASKRRAAPPPPPYRHENCNTSNNDLNTLHQKENSTSHDNQPVIQSEENEVFHVQNNDVLPIRPPRKKKHFKSFTNTIHQDCADDDLLIKTNDAIEHDIEVKKQNCGTPSAKNQDDLEHCDHGFTQYSNKVSESPAVTESENDNVCAPNSSSKSMNFCQQTAIAIEESNLKGNNMVTDKSNNDEILPNMSDTIDHVLEEFDSVINQADVSLNLTDKSKESIDCHVIEKVHQSGLQFGDIIVYDVGEDGDIIEGNTPLLSQSNEVDISYQTESINPLVQNNNLPPPPDAFFEEELSQVLADIPDVDLSSKVELTQMTFDENSDKESEAYNHMPKKSDYKQKIYHEDNSNFDSSPQLHNPNEITANQLIYSKPVFRTDEEVQITLTEAVNETSDKPVLEKSNEEMTETDKTILEIERLHTQIKKMRIRNSMKDAGKNSIRSPAAVKSFTLVPNRQPEISHEDYEAAPVTGIELSSNGEIKSLDHPHDTSDTCSSVKSRETAKPHATLPSYYKKFLKL